MTVNINSLSGEGDQGPWIYPAEACRILGLDPNKHRSRLRKWADEGKLERWQPHGVRSTSLYRRSSVYKFAEGTIGGHS